MEDEKPVEYLILESLDNKRFKVKVNIAKMFFVLKSMMEDAVCDEETPVKLTLISGRALEKMIEFAEIHQNDPPVPEDAASRERRRTSEIKEIDKQFISNLDQSLIFELIVATNFLDFKILLDLLCKTVANMIKNKSVDEIRKTFNIVNDFTSDEEQQLRQANSWIEKD